MLTKRNLMLNLKRSTGKDGIFTQKILKPHRIPESTAFPIKSGIILSFEMASWNAFSYKKLYDWTLGS